MFSRAIGVEKRCIFSMYSTGIEKSPVKANRMFFARILQKLLQNFLCFFFVYGMIKKTILFGKGGPFHAKKREKIYQDREELDSL